MTNEIKMKMSAREAAEKAIVDDATIERFGKQPHCVNHSFDKNGRNVWSTGFKRISAKEAAELVAYHGWTLDEYVAAKTHWQKKVDADYEINAAMSEVNTSADAIDAAVEAEIEIINNAATEEIAEYIFTAYQTVTGVDCNGRTERVEAFTTRCKEIGDDDNFTGLYREVTFYEDWHYNAWDIKTADGKLIAKGNTEAELKKAYKAIKAGNVEISEETAEVNERRFLVSVHYDSNNGNGMESKHFATSTDAANYIIAFAKENPEYVINTDTNIRDFDVHKKYTLTDADLHILNGKPGTDVDPDEYAITQEAMDVAIKAEEYNAYVADITEQILSDPDVDAAYRAAKERIEVAFTARGNIGHLTYIKKNGERSNDERVAKAYISKCGLSETSFIVKAKHDTPSADIADAETAEVIPVEKFWYEVEIAELSEQDAADIVAHFHGQDGANKFFKMRATELDGSEEDDDNDNVFDLLPTLDELQDVDNMPLVAGEEIHADKRFNTYKVNGEVIHLDKGVWYLVESDKYGVRLFRDEGVITWDIKDINGRRLKVDCTEAEFWRATIERGACTIDLTDAEMLTAKLKEVTRKARLMGIYPQNGRRIVDNLYKVEIVPDGGGFIFTNGYEAFARYDNREQCQDVIERIKTAIDGCDTEFEFPTAELVDLEKKLHEQCLRQFDNYRYIGKGYWQMRTGGKWHSVPRRTMAASLKYYGLTASDLRKYKTA